MLDYYSEFSANDDGLIQPDEIRAAYSKIYNMVGHGNKGFKLTPEEHEIEVLRRYNLREESEPSLDYSEAKEWVFSMAAFFEVNPRDISSPVPSVESDDGLEAAAVRVGIPETLERRELEAPLVRVGIPEVQESETIKVLELATVHAGVRGGGVGAVSTTGAWMTTDFHLVEGTC